MENSFCGDIFLVSLEHLNRFANISENSSEIQLFSLFTSATFAQNAYKGRPAYKICKKPFNKKGTDLI